MKKYALSFAAILGMSGCYLPSLYARHEIGLNPNPRLQVGYVPAAGTIVYDSVSAREYVCTYNERIETCIRRACFQSTWGVNNCVVQSMGNGYIGIFPGGVSNGVVVQNQPSVQFEYHHHDNSCNHKHKRNNNRSHRRSNKR